MTRIKTGKILECLHCNVQVYIPKNRLKTFKYCSRSCAALAGRVHITTKCEICGTNFNHISSRANKAKYCSRSCYYKAMHLKGSVICNCAHCDKEFKASPSENRKYCSRSCINKENKSTWNPKFSTIRKAMKARHMINKCERCGYNEEPRILGVHHKDRNRTNNSLDNLEVLCPICHSLEHLKHIP